MSRSPVSWSADPPRRGRCRARADRAVSRSRAQTASRADAQSRARSRTTSARVPSTQTMRADHEQMANESPSRRRDWRENGARSASGIKRDILHPKPRSRPKREFRGICAIVAEPPRRAVRSKSVLPPPKRVLGLKPLHACARSVTKTVPNLSLGRPGSVRAVEVAVAEPKKSARRISRSVPLCKC